MQEMATSVRLWWATLAMLALCNVGFWAYASVAFLRRRSTAPRAQAARLPHVYLSACVVFCAAFLWMLPRAAMQRLCMVDSWLSSALVGRCVQSLAELCFVMQWTLFLSEMARAERSGFARQVARCLLPLAAIAQGFAWFAVATQSHLGLALEQAVWAVMVGATALSLVGLWRRTFSPLRGFLALAIVLCVALSTYAWAMDIPLHLARFLADQAQHRVYPGFRDGLRDAATNYVLARDFGASRTQMGWPSFAANLGIWLSIAFIHAPLSHRAYRTSFFPSRESKLRLPQLPTSPGTFKS